MTQEALAARVAISRPRLSDIEAGDGAGVPLETWFAVAKALGLYLRFEFGRDPQQELRDAGHLDIQELVVRVAAAGGWRAEWESRSRFRSIDVRLSQAERVVVVECWNTFGDLGEAIRSSDYKIRDIGEAGLLWVVRDTRANREMLGRYGGLLDSRFRGSSVAWLHCLRLGGQMPKEAGLVWCDVRSTRLYARRR